MVTIPPAKKPSHRTKVRPAVSAPPAVALTLVAASIDDDVTVVTLQFDRDIDISAMDVTAIQIGTITTGNLYQGDGSPSLIDPATVQVPLTSIGAYGPTNIELFATDASGIVAVDDGGTWSGTAGTGLPFP